MKYFSMFSGIGGFEYGIEKATDGKWECVGYSEIDKHAIAVYSHRFPGQRNYGDATRIDPSELPCFDMLCGGFPCQAFSVAGKREGFGDTRGTLFFEIARILEAKRPPYCFLENVKGLLNHDGGKTFGVIIEALGSLGYDMQWFLLNSKFHGVPQNRERVFIVGSLGGVRKPQILPLGESAEEVSGVLGKEGSDTHKVYDCYNRKLRADGIAGALKGEGVAETSIGTAIVMNTITQAFGRIGHSKEEMRMSKAIMEADKVMLRDGRDNRSCLRSGRTPEVGYEGYSIRRLTPTECERLQGFPDGWTMIGKADHICTKKDDNGYYVEEPIYDYVEHECNEECDSVCELVCEESLEIVGYDKFYVGENNLYRVSDTQRYKMLGNAVTTNVIEAIVRSWIRNVECE